MDRFASNTLRTLAIVAISIVVVVGSLGLILLALCIGMLGGASKGTQAHLFYGAIAVAIVLITIGVLSVAKLAKGIVHENPVPPLRWNMPAVDAGSSAPALEATSAAPHPQLAASTPSTAAPLAPPTSTAHPTAAHSAPDVLTHLSPASRNAIHRLTLAVLVQIAAQLIPLAVGLRLLAVPLPIPSRNGFLLAFLPALASNIPYFILLASLLRRPTRRTFAYALAVPSILIFFGFFSSSATIFYLLRMSHSPAMVLLAIPWILHVLIFYLAWKAIRLTGILPNPARIVLAAVFTFLYYALLLPALSVLLVLVSR